MLSEKIPLKTLNGSVFKMDPDLATEMFRPARLDLHESCTPSLLIRV